jgi:hypothetical protein
MSRALVPEDLQRRDPFVPLVRSVIAIANSAFDRSVSPSEFARRNWRDDRGTEYVVRAATNPATTTTAGWAAELSPVSLVFLAALRGLSAGATLLTRGLQVRFNGEGEILLPTIAAGSAGFVGQGKPIPVAQFASSTGVSLLPHKIALITTLTSEMLQSSNAEAIVRTVLVESTAVGLDAALFSANAATADAPAGLLNGIAPLTASTGGTGANRTDALLDDLKALTAALAPVAGGSPIVFVVNPVDAISLAYRLVQQLTDVVLSSAAVPAGTIIAIAVNALASGYDPTPEITASREAELHMSDAPTDVPAAPTMTMFQSNRVALKIRMPLAWTLRDVRGLAWVQSIVW